MLKYQFWDHKIKLKSEKESIFESIYALSEKELQILYKYIKINKKKESI